MSPHTLFPLLRLLPLLAILGLLAQSVSANSDINLVPLPTNSTTGTTVTCLGNNFKVTYDTKSPPRDLTDAAQRMITRIRQSHHRYLSIEYGAEHFPKGPKCTNTVNELHMSFSDTSSIASQTTKEVEDRDEAYSLTIPASGTATATGTNALAMFRALTSFENVWYKIGADGNVALDVLADDQTNAKENNDITYAPFAPYTIDDTPAFPWRSIMLDTSRHYFRKSVLLRLLDAMASVKLSAFHWHITDSQSFPLQLSGYPELSANGAYQKRIYTEADVKEIIAYAAARGIDVVVEIDNPGHSQVIGKSHPDFITCMVEWSTSGNLRWANATVANWTTGMLTSAASLSSSKYFGTGGDEVPTPCMDEDPATQASLAERNMTLEEAFGEFTINNHQALLKGGKTPVVWEEIALEHNFNLSNRTIVNAWISTDSPRQIAEKGYRFVHALSDYFYLDCGAGLWVGNNATSFNSWCDPFKSWQLIYSYNPLANLTESQQSLILGGQASLWCEQTDENNVDTMVWPRAAALAELFWSGTAGTANGEYPRSSIDAFPRMHDIRYRLVDRRVRAVPLQPEYCALRPGACKYPKLYTTTIPA